MAPRNSIPRKRSTIASQLAAVQVEKEANQYLPDIFLPQTPLDSSTPTRTGSPASSSSRFLSGSRRVPPWWLQWATNPCTFPPTFSEPHYPDKSPYTSVCVDVALKVLITPVILYFNWNLVTPYVSPGLANPFAPIFLLSGHVSTSEGADVPRYAKSYYDLIFLAYYTVFFSFVREYLAITVSQPLARFFGLRKEGKIDSYPPSGTKPSTSGSASPLRPLPFPSPPFSLLSPDSNTPRPTTDYPHWDMPAELKRYYLMQFSYWCQQFIVLVLGLEKPRKDYKVLVAHHFVTLWLVGWSYLLNLTIIGNAVYMSMDIPDAFFAASKLLNYIQWERAKVVAFGIFIGIWTYFRHYLNLKILWSVWFESSLVPAVITREVDDDRSDDEDEGEEDSAKRD
ncbi:hypothetical protein MD484_g7844, partial [Candolleomyces efflorescens]